MILGGRQCLSLLLPFCLFNILILILLELCSDIVFSNKLVVYDLELVGQTMTVRYSLNPFTISNSIINSCSIEYLLQ